MASNPGKNRNLRVRATGAEDARRLVAMLRQAFPDAKFSLDRRIADENGDLAYVWTAHGTHTGEAGGYAPTGAPATIHIVTSVGRRPQDEEKP